MHKMRSGLSRFLTIVVTILLYFPVLNVSSQVPKTVLYQGTLTDNNGVPVVDGTYFIHFRIWSDSTSENTTFKKWDGNIQAFDIVGGILEAKLGAPPMAPLPNNIFTNDSNLYLGLQVGTAPELRPRIKFTAVPYAYKALFSDTALVVAQNSVSGASIIDGSIGLKELSQDSAASGEVITWDGSKWTTAPGSTGTSKIDSIAVGGGLGGGGDSGFISIYVLPDGITALQLSPNSVGSVELQSNSVGSAHILPSAVGQSELATSSVGTSEIADNAVIATDIFDEPGIAQSRKVDSILLLANAMTDLVSVTITIPSSGFIFLTGRVNLRFSGATNSSTALIEIDEVIGGTEIPGQYSSVGLSTYPSTGDYKFSCTSQRIYAKNAGTYTFRLEGRKIISVLQSQIEASSAILTAMYFPTSYGGVQPVGNATSTPEIER